MTQYIGLGIDHWVNLFSREYITFFKYCCFDKYTIIVDLLVYVFLYC